MILILAYSIVAVEAALEPLQLWGILTLVIAELSTLTFCIATGLFVQNRLNTPHN